MINQLISSFNAGELSPLLESRTNLDKYRNGCKSLENFLITPYGPANRRAGLQYLGQAKLPSKRCRLIGLNLTATSRFILELGEGYMRFWKNGLPVTLNGTPVEAVAVDWQGNIIPPPASPHPFTESQFRDISVLQINNVVYFAHPDCPPYRLSRYSDTDWKMGEVPWSFPPVLDQNYGTTTITPSATTGTITLTASAPLFDPTNHIDSYWQIDHAPTTALLSHAITANNTSSTLSVLGKWQIQSFGSWTAEIQLQSSTDGGATWEQRRTFKSSGGDFNVVTTGEEQIQTLFRFVVSGWVSIQSATPARIQLAAIDPVLQGCVRITAIASTTSATARVVKTLGATTATSRWSEGAFSKKQGFPNAIGLHESRLIFAGTATLPNTIWGSYSNDFENFRKGSFDDNAWMFTLASTTGGRINWLLSKNVLLVGTTLDEWSVGSTDSGKALTATNVTARAQSQYGSDNLPALVINDTILYVQRMGRKIRELVYTWSSETWVSNDITALAEHTTRTLIKEIAYQRVPDAIYWFVRGDGQLVSMTYEREQQVVGFARHKTDGEIESIATINGIDGEDEVWVAVKRTINNQVVRYIERLKLGMREALDTGDKANWFFVDAGVTKTPTYVNGIPQSSSTITGLSHLEGKSVSVWGGVYNANKNEITYGVITPVINSATNLPMVVTNGQLTLQTPVAAYSVGLPFTSLLVPQRVDQQLSDGTSQSRKMRIPRLNIKLYQSFAGEYSSDQVNWFPMVSRKTNDFMDTSSPVINEWTRMFLSSNWQDGVDIYIRQNLPIPLTIAAIVPVWEASEGQN